MWLKGSAAVFFLLSIFLLAVGCGPKLSSLLSESWSENYALARYGAEASHLEINDGSVKTWGVTQPPDRVYIITLPEEKEVKRVIIYGGNIISYQLFYWDSEGDKWRYASDVTRAKITKLANYEQLKFEMLRFDHRLSFKTNKIKLQVNKAKSDRIITTRTPPDDEASIINSRTEYIGAGRSRIRLTLYDVFERGPAKVREIEVYGHLEKPKID